MLDHIRIRQGLLPSSDGAPTQQLAQDDCRASMAAILGGDYPGLRPSLKVVPGDPVCAGDIVFIDRKFPEIAFAAPLSGRVKSIDYGPRRTLSAIIFEANQTPLEAAPDGGQSGDVPQDDGQGSTVRNILLTRGLWPAFRTRPFGGIPAPDAQPDAIFVNAVQPSPQAPDPGIVLDQQIAEFQSGIEMLTRLTTGPVYVCQSPKAALGTFSDGVKSVQFSGTMAAGLAGTHIHRLHPVSPGASVWSIGYQDVAAIGHLFKTGQYLSRRVVSISGPRATKPKLVRTCLGANLHDVCQDQMSFEQTQGAVEIWSGDKQAGREAAFLGRYDQQITITSKTPDRSWWQKVLRPPCAPRALIPMAGLERALAIDVLPVPLMRALSVGDSEAANRLGCLALVEEDVAALSQTCTSGADYGVLLRAVLDELAEDMC